MLVWRAMRATGGKDDFPLDPIASAHGKRESPELVVVMVDGPDEPRYVREHVLTN